MKSSSCIYHRLTELIQLHPECVLATVISTQGSTPQKAGSSALIGTEGLLAGTVGGGITEMKIIQEAQIRLKSKESILFSFELHGEIEKGSESICGGSMKILIDASPKLHLPVFRLLNKSLEQHIPGVLLNWIDQSDPKNLVITRYLFTKEIELYFPGELGKAVDSIVTKMLDHPVASCQSVEMGTHEYNRNDLILLESILPKPNLIIAGAGHIGQALAPLAKTLGFSVTVWDDRPEYADIKLFPDADVVLIGMNNLDKINILNDSYLAIVTHGHKSDADVLRKFIGSGAAYIGMIGSKAKVSQMKTSFLENKWATWEQWNQIFAPVGLDVGAQTVEEIAVSIAAQLIQVRNQKLINHE
jgi:xanthine dehydrogenase accessory factor